jgi:penicillin amidase
MALGRAACALFEHPLQAWSIRLKDKLHRVALALGIGVHANGSLSNERFCARIGRVVPDGARRRQWDASRVVNTPGESGNPDSPHYRDLAPLWADGKYFPLLYTRAAIEKATESRVVLQPKN